MQDPGVRQLESFERPGPHGVTEVNDLPLQKTKHGDVNSIPTHTAPRTRMVRARARQLAFLGLTRH